MLSDSFLQLSPFYFTRKLSIYVRDNIFKISPVKFAFSICKIIEVCMLEIYVEYKSL